MRKIYVAIFILIYWNVKSQDDLMKELQESQKPETNYVLQTFKGTRIINGQSVETKGKGELEFIFSHRFDKINTGSYHAWGLDGYALVRLGLEYGVTDRFGVGLGRVFSYGNKMVDLYGRYKLFQQSTGAKVFPVTVTAIGTMTYQAYPNAANATLQNPDISTSDRMGYVLEVLIARKFSSKFSAQISPMIVHRNAVVKAFENNDDYAIGFAARYRFTKSVALLGEYNARMNANANSPYYNSAGLGVDIETGGHVFQLIFTNSLGLNPQSIVTQTDGNIGSGDIHFGFNVTRTFQLGKRK